MTENNENKENFHASETSSTSNSSSSSKKSLKNTMTAIAISAVCFGVGWSAADIIEKKPSFENAFTGKVSSSVNVDMSSFRIIGDKKLKEINSEFLKNSTLKSLVFTAGMSTPIKGVYYVMFNGRDAYVQPRTGVVIEGNLFMPNGVLASKALYSMLQAQSGITGEMAEYNIKHPIKLGNNELSPQEVAQLRSKQNSNSSPTPEQLSDLKQPQNNQNHIAHSKVASKKDIAAFLESELATQPVTKESTVAAMKRVVNKAAHVGNLSANNLGFQSKMNVPVTKSDLTPTESAEQIKMYGNSTTSQFDSFKKSLVGRINPENLSIHKSYIIYKNGKNNPRLTKYGYDKNGKQLDVKTKEAQITKAVNFIAKAGDNWSIPYLAKNEKAKMVVFIDPTCPYCKKLHADIEKYNEMGVSVYYLFYPRTMGLGLKNAKLNHTIDLMDSVWFQKPEDRPDAMTAVFKGYKPDHDQVPSNKPNPVFEHYLLAELIGIDRGTPKVILSNGREVNGYLPAEKMKQIIFAK